MTAFVVWSRRSLAVWTAPVVLGALLYGAWSMDGWQYEWLWGMRSALVVLPLVSPLVAGATAFDVARRWVPVITALGQSAQRWRLATLALPSVHVAWAFATICLVWLVTAARLFGNDAIWQLDATLPWEVIASLAAAAAVGLLIGTRVPNLGAAPLAAVVVFGVELMASPYGLGAVFTAMPVVSSIVGVERNPQAALLAIALNGAVAAGCCLLALRGGRTTLKWSAACGVAAAVVIATATVERVASPLEFRAIPSRPTCVSTGAVQVCGAPNARSLISTLSASLDAAVTQLSTSQLNLPRRFVLSVPGTLPSTSDAVTIAVASPAQLSDGRRTATVAGILAQPRFCRQYVDPGPDTTALLDRQALVASWLEPALRGRGGTAPTSVQQAYADLLACKPTV